MTLVKMVIACLKSHYDETSDTKPLKSRDIARMILDKYPIEAKRKAENSPDNKIREYLKENKNEAPLLSKYTGEISSCSKKVVIEEPKIRIGKNDNGDLEFYYNENEHEKDNGTVFSESFNNSKGRQGKKLAHLIVKCLRKRPDEYFSGKDIARMILDDFPEEAKIKAENSKNIILKKAYNNEDMGYLIDQYAREIPSKRKEVRIIDSKMRVKIAGSNRWEFCYDTIGDESEEYIDIVYSHQKKSNEVKSKQENNNKEKKLYPLLQKYLLSELKIYSKRISESKGINHGSKGTNKWLYPDIVGAENLSVLWEHSVRGCAGAFSGKKAQLWSFEVKVTLTSQNVRKYFFQAVSNSSWANFSYLVASEIEDDAMEELRMLSTLHGIGVIQLDSENPVTDSRIMIPARERSEVDWSSIDRLVKESKEFAEYIMQIEVMQSKGFVDPTKWYVLESDNS